MFGPEVDAEILSTAKAHEEEICGVIVDGSPVFLPNGAGDPKENFLINDIPPNAEAIFHSHPGGPFYPSHLDMQQQYATMLPWAIACTNPRHNEVFWFGETVPKLPLIGRPFRHGVTDCYELIRDFYGQVHGVELPHVPREWSWWDDDQSLYEDHLTSSGFVLVPFEDVQPGDGVLLTIRSKTPNHAAVYLGNGLILHHLGTRNGYDPSRLSSVEPISPWTPFITKVVTLENNQIDRTPLQGIL